MTANSRIHNIIFDFGGVICDLEPERCLQEFQKLGCSLDIFPKHYAQFEGIFQQIDRGTMSIPEFYDAVRELGGAPQATDEQIAAAWNSLLVPIQRERMIAFKQLKDAYNLYILSNANDIHWQYLNSKSMYFEGEHITPWFKHVFLSYVLHLEKPEPEIYQAVLQMAGIKAEETLFIDDNKLNLEAAAKLGIQTFHSQNGDWIEALKDRGIL